MKLKIRSSFSLKIISVVLTGILVPLAATMLLCMYNYYKMVSSTVNSISIQQVDFIANYMTNTFSSTRENISIWMINNDITSLMTVSDIDADTEEKINNSLKDFHSIDPNYINAYLCVPSQEKLYHAYSESVDIQYETVQDSAMLQKIERSWQLNAFLYPYGKSPSTLAVVVPIRDKSDRNFLGYCMLKLSSLYLINTFNLSDQPFGTIYCVDSEGNIACTNDSSTKLPFDFDPSMVSAAVQKIHGYNVYCRHIDNSELYILNVSPVQFWKWDFTMPFAIGIVISIIIVILSLCVTIFSAKHLLSPIYSLAEAMAANDPNHLKPVQLEDFTDEIGILHRTYNSMIERINNMIETQYRSDLILKDTQLRALQFQINPHFVNNTLQVISEIALEHDIYEICDLLQAFSHMFYYTLRFKSGVVEFHDELTYLKYYIVIQEHRFPNKFFLNFDIDESAKSMDIPKMTLQPILENVFSHALTGLSRRVNVTVFTAIHDDSYEIFIEDDGCGMNENTLKQLQNNMKTIRSDTTSEPSQTSIGLKNVNSRIKLLYGDAYGISVTSELYIGTTVSIHLPIRGKSE